MYSVNTAQCIQVVLNTSKFIADLCFRYWTLPWWPVRMEAMGLIETIKDEYKTILRGQKGVTEEQKGGEAGAGVEHSDVENISRIPF